MNEVKMGKKTSLYDQEERLSLIGIQVANLWNEGIRYFVLTGLPYNVMIPGINTKSFEINVKPSLFNDPSYLIKLGKVIDEYWERGFDGCSMGEETIYPVMSPLMAEKAKLKFEPKRDKDFGDDYNYTERRIY